MEIIEEKRDLFTLDVHKYVFAHNISCDCAMGAGIVVPFKKRHRNLKHTCFNYSKSKEFKTLGTTFKYSDDKGIVYNMFTKQNVWENSTTLGEEVYLKNLKSCLYDLKLQMILNNEKYLALPKIGCGLDRCNWSDVKMLIEEVFNNTEIEVRVCYL